MGLAATLIVLLAVEQALLPVLLVQLEDTLVDLQADLALHVTRRVEHVPPDHRGHNVLLAHLHWFL